MNTFQSIKKPFINYSLETFLTLRALLFVGNKYTCPCCGWKLRAFTHGGNSLKIRPLGYCPRCNSKARHRRWWLFLQQKTNLFTDHLRLLHASPNYCLSRRFKTLPNIDYVGIDHKNHRNISVKMALPTTPFISETFDAILCIHVLEHFQEDRKAIHELYRVLKPGGWAGISVPIRLDQKTFEDPTITSPEERERHFGETVHVRYYGYDLVDRLEEAGFKVKMYPGKEVDQQSKLNYGLREDENIFYCTK
jgi:predicted SAM-dependent methyltransferase